MADGNVLVLDVGKTNSKLSLLTRGGQRLGALARANRDVEATGYRALDVEGIAAWLKASLKTFARDHRIDAIVPIAHGAAAAIVTNGNELAAAPMSYETPLASNIAYENARDAFAETGSPRLPNGLNLGAQLDRLDDLMPEVFGDGGQIIPYPQFWAWLLSGVAASEVSSLGCHTDLWRPRANTFSELAQRRGWGRLFAPLRRANEVIGRIRPSLADKTGLPHDCAIYCGAHDSNAAFYGARAHPKLSGKDLTIVSTGTWFVAMRAPSVGDFDRGDLSAERDTLINVGVDGLLIPSARFMGGREMEELIGAEDSPMRTPDFAREIAPLGFDEVFATGAMILPTFAPGVGPFPRGSGRWLGDELKGPARRAAAGFYLALVTDASLSLIGARDAIVVEGRFADDTSFLRMLAALRPDCAIYAARAEDGIAHGALRLVNPDFVPDMALTKIKPLERDISAYAARWRLAAGGDAMIAERK